MQRSDTNKQVNGNSSLDSSAVHHSLQDLSESITDLRNKVREGADTAMRESIDFVKRYPVHTALGAVAVGFLIGFLSRGSKH